MGDYVGDGLFEIMRTKPKGAKARGGAKIAKTLCVVQLVTHKYDCTSLPIYTGGGKRSGENYL